jgi:hypothetical protein
MLIAKFETFSLSRAEMKKIVGGDTWCQMYNTCYYNANETVYNLPGGWEDPNNAELLANLHTACDNAFYSGCMGEMGG